MKLKIYLRWSLFCVLLFSVVLLLRIGGSKDLIASLGQIPGLAESSDKGTLVDLVKAMDEVYTEGKIKIEVYPFTRSIDNLIKGKADFHLPMFNNPFVPVSKLPYRYISESIGRSSFVLYSNKDKPITKKVINAALAKGGEFPYKIEASRSLEGKLNIPIIGHDNVEQSFRKVEAKRIDALLWGQEEGDLLVRNLKLKTIYRSRFYDFNESIIIQKGPEGDRINKILSDVVRKLRKTGKLQELFLKVHSPYEDWQPAQMGW